MGEGCDFDADNWWYSFFKKKADCFNVEKR